MYLSRLLVVLLVLLTAPSSQAKPVLTHDIGILIVYPVQNSRMPINIPQPVKVEIANQGTAEADDVQISVTIRDQNQQVVFDDETTVSDLAVGVAFEVYLGDLTPHSHGPYTVRAVVEYALDEEPEDNIVEVTAYVRYEMNARAVAVAEPDDLTAVPQKTSFKIRGLFANGGVADLYDVPARAIIRRCSDNKVVFQSDSLIPMLLQDSGNSSFTFPSRTPQWDVRMLQPGCHTIALIVRYPTDGDRMDDTAVSEFSISSNKLSNDVAVDSILTPSPNARLVAREPVLLQVRFRNTGKNTQLQVKAVAAITNLSGETVYRDSTVLMNWSSDATKTHLFKAFDPQVNGSYTLHVLTSLPSDEYRLDDTLRQQFKVGYDRDAALTIVSPPHEQSYEVGTPVTVSVKADWVGADYNIKGRARIVVYDPFMDKNVALAFVEFPQISLANPVAVLAIADSAFVAAMQKLAPRSYLIFASFLNSDENARNNGDTINFHVTAEQDIQPFAFVSPRDQDQVFATPIPITVRVRNHGSSDVTMASVNVRIERSGRRVVYDDTVLVSIGATQNVEVDLPSFTPPINEQYNIFAITSVAGDVYPQNDTLGGAFYARFVRDLSIESSLVPKANEQLIEGKAFTPKVRVRSAGTDMTLPIADVTVNIRECTTNTLRFSSTLSDQQLGGQNDVWLPDTSSMGSTGDLEVGCYTATFYVDYYLEENRTNDTLRVPFTVAEPSSVAEVLKQLHLPWPNPTDGDVTLDVVGIYTVIVRDNTGREIRSVPTLGSNTMKLPLNDFPAGVYLIELRSSSNGVVRTHKVIRQ